MAGLGPPSRTMDPGSDCSRCLRHILLALLVPVQGLAEQHVGPGGCGCGCGFGCGGGKLGGTAGCHEQLLGCGQASCDLRQMLTSVVTSSPPAEPVNGERSATERSGVRGQRVRMLNLVPVRVMLSPGLPCLSALLGQPQTTGHSLSGVPRASLPGWRPCPSSADRSPVPCSLHMRGPRSGSLRPCPRRSCTRCSGRCWAAHPRHRGPRGS